MTRLHERTPTAEDTIVELTATYDPHAMMFVTWADDRSLFHVRATTITGRILDASIAAHRSKEAEQIAWHKIRGGTFDDVLRPWQFTDPPAIAYTPDVFPRLDALADALDNLRHRTRERLAVKLHDTADRLDPDARW